jgi:peptidoglycan/LPS O-acetylase OafA/YrhL
MRTENKKDMTTISNKKSINNFDLLRLFAATQVVFMHATSHLEHSYSVLSFLSYFPGVPIFFFLSGFLIYGSYESSSNNKNPIRNFYLKRVLRLYPGLWGCLFFSIFLVWCSGYFGNISLNIKEIMLWLVAQMTAFQFYNPDFLRGFGAGTLNGALWTISVELQFYLLVPLVYKLMQQKKVVILSTILIFIVFNIFNDYFNDKDNIILKLINVSFAPWFYMFLVGAFFAKFKEYISSILSINIFVLFVAFVSMYYMSDYFGLDWGNKTHPIGYALMISIVIHAAYVNPTLSDRILGRNDISYGVYIYHMPVINYILYIYGPGEVQFISAILGTLFLAVMSWFIIERPSLRLKTNALRKN